MTSTSRTIKAVVLLGGGVTAGVIAASAYGATAANTTSGTPSVSTAIASTMSDAPKAPHLDETAVTGSKAATLKAAALAKVPGATVERIETDSGPAAYEVHLTKSDGTHVTVTFDTNLKYVATETHTGRGGHGHGGPGGHDEAAVTGSKATTLKAAALAKVPGATVDASEVDSGDAAYEVHLTKSDGSHVTVKFDKNLAYVSTETGRGK